MDEFHVPLKKCRKRSSEALFGTIVEVHLQMERVKEGPVPASPICTPHDEPGPSFSLNRRANVFRSSPPRLATRAAGGSKTPLEKTRSERRIRGLNSHLLEAIKCKDRSQVEKLINQGANPNATCYLDYVSACHLAVLAGGDILNLLISRGAERMRADRLGRTPLHIAAWNGNVAQIALLLNIPLEILEKIIVDMSFETMDPISTSNSIYKEFVNVRCELNEEPRNLQRDWLDNIDHDCTGYEDKLRLLLPGWTPLHAASANAQPQAVLLLLAAGSDPQIRDVNDRSALDVAGSACYNGLRVEAKNFEEVINLLITADPKGYVNNSEEHNTPLHTAVEVESIDAIRYLLDVGASVFSLNKAGLTPMHVCVQKKLQEYLEVLVYSGFSDSEHASAVVEAKDKYGRTVLHCAIRAQWGAGLCVALEAGANVATTTKDGETSIHLAAELGNTYILNEILSAAKSENYDVHFTQLIDETALYKAAVNGHSECVRMLLEDGASIEATFPLEGNLFHITAEKGLFEVLRVLVDYDYLVTKEMINLHTEDDGRGFTPLHLAVLNNHLDCVEFLLSSDACVSLEATLGNYKNSTTLHLAAMKNNIEMVKILVMHDKYLVHKVDHLNWTPLHTAIHYKNRDVILFLIDEGADLSACIGGPVKLRKSAIYMIISNLPKPTELIEEVFDSYIQSNNLSLQDPECEITVYYDVILPKNSSKGQLAVIEEIIKSGNRQNQLRLLIHPLVESFLYLKWKALLPFFFTMVILYGAFVISLTIFIVSVFFFKDTKIDAPNIFNPTGWAIVVYVTAVLWLLQELIFLSPTRRYYFLQMETCIKLCSVLMALILPPNVTDVTADLDWVRHVATMSVLLSWVGLMFLLSRFPKWGYYVLMFKKVSLNVFRILLAFAFLIIGFSFSFMIQFHSKPPFESPFAALVKTMVMMSSEFDYDDLTDKDKKKYLSSSLLTIRLVFLGFLIFTSIVLMNLMVGVAVNDLRNLELMGHIRRLEKQVELLVALEALANNKFFSKILPAKIQDKLTVKKEITLYAIDNYVKIPEKVTNSIFKIIGTRREHNEKELDSQTFKKKLDEVFCNVVKYRRVLKKIKKNMKKVNIALESAQKPVESSNQETRGDETK